MTIEPEPLITANEPALFATLEKAQQLLMAVLNEHHRAACDGNCCCSDLSCFRWNLDTMISLMECERGVWLRNPDRTPVDLPTAAELEPDQPHFVERW